jgi:predicted permease
MRVEALIFITIVAIICCFGMIAMIGSQQANDPTKQADSLGKMPNAATNNTNQLITNVGVKETEGLGLGAVFAAFAVVISIVLGFMVLFRKKSPGGQKWRT